MSAVSCELLKIAQGKLNSADSKHCPQTCTNMKSFIDNMIKLLDTVVLDEGSVASVATLLASSTLPLEANDYRIVVDGLAYIENALSQAHDGLLQHSMHSAANCQCSSSPDELLTLLANVCRTALPNGSLLPILQRFVMLVCLGDFYIG